MSHCRVPMVPRKVTSAPCSWATYATAIVSLWTSMPIKSVRDWDMVDLRVESCCCDNMRLWLRVSSPAFHRGSTSRHQKSLCLGTRILQNIQKALYVRLCFMYTSGSY